MPREGASSIHPKSPLLRPCSEKVEQACLVQTLLGTLHEHKGKEGVNESKKKKGDASDAKSLEDIRAAGGAKKTHEGEGYCGQLEDGQARYLRNRKKFRKYKERRRKLLISGNSKY